MPIKPLSLPGLALTLLFCGVLATACSPKITTRGNLLQTAHLQQLQPGRVGKADVQRLLGQPSAVSLYDPDIWYYMSQRREQWAFLKPEVVDQQVVELQFGPGGVLQSVKEYDEDDMWAINPANETTPTAGSSPSVVRQLLGNLGRVGTVPN